MTQSKSLRDTAINTETPTKYQTELKHLKEDFKTIKNSLKLILKQYESELNETKENVTVLMRDVCGIVNIKDKFLFELRKTAINEIEKLRNDKIKLFSALAKINSNIKEATVQANFIENRVKSTEFLNNTKTFCDKETNTENESVLIKELELHDRIAQDFQQKLKNIEDKYKNASQEKFNYNTLKQQIVELATKLHKYKSLYEESRKGMTEFLTISNNHIKNLENKVLAIDKARRHTQKEMDILKMLVEDREMKVKNMQVLLTQQKNVRLFSSLFVFC